MVETFNFLKNRVTLQHTCVKRAEVIGRKRLVWNTRQKKLNVPKSMKEWAGGSVCMLLQRGFDFELIVMIIWERNITFFEVSHAV